MKFIKQSIMALSGFVVTTKANAYGLVIVAEAPVASVPESSTLSLTILSLVVVGVVAAGTSLRKLH